MASKRKYRPKPVKLEATLWKCDDLKAVIGETLKAHVKDVELARRLEHALGDEIAYGDGGGGGVGIA
jgi:hypothetical protein